MFRHSSLFAILTILGICCYDEVKMYQDGRYIGSSEAAWRLFSFPLHEEYPRVQRLQLHLPGYEHVRFVEGRPLPEVIENMHLTTLTGWFVFNRAKKAEYEANLLIDPQAQPHRCLKTLYHQFPSIATWNSKSYSWHDRSTRNQPEDPPIGRMYFVPPTQRDRHYLRLLLLNTPGATSFEDLRTTTDPSTGMKTLQETFLQACVLRGLCRDDYEWTSCLTEACTFQMPSQLRTLFVTILMFNEVGKPVTLWNSFKDQIK
jgi:ATP-dependent DNA helicase PIF1